MARFEIDTEIFKDQSVLDRNYQPDEFIGREEEEEKLTSALLPLAREGSADNTFVYGQTGTGKTCATNIILDDLKEESQEWDHDVRVIQASCKGKTNYELSIELANRFRHEDNQVPGRGFQEGRVMDLFLEELEKLPEEHIVIVLDEVDKLGENPGLLYHIPRGQEMGKLEETQPALITISNNFRYMDHLEPKTYATLRGLSIHFDPYDATELSDILRDRADKAFYDDVIEDGVIEWIAARAAQDTGSARHALNVLQKSGRMAEENNDDMIREDDHARPAYEEVRLDRIAGTMTDLGMHEHALMYCMSLLDREDITPCTRDTVYSTYESVAEELGLTPKASRTIHEDLNELGFNGFIHRGEVNEGKGGGRRYTYDLNMSTNAVIQGLEEETDLIPESKPGKEHLNHSLARYQ